ncbi:MAG: enoyl-CoA hydratase [Gammaproteobacteria bacterium]
MNHIAAAREGAVQRIQLNRPEKKNAITIEMYAALAEAITAAERDRSVRVLLLHGAGDTFCAGNDLQDFLTNPPQDEESPGFRFLRVMSHATKPLVAAVHGAAVGIGTTMLLHCDLVYAADSAHFHLPFVNLGLCPEGASSVLLPVLAGYPRAAELLMFGEPFGAAKARDVGLVTEVVPEAELLAVVTAAAKKLADKPPGALKIAKQLLRRALMPQIEAALEEESKQLRALLRSPEAKEAFTAFLEKRKPDFSKFG